MQYVALLASLGWMSSAPNVALSQYRNMDDDTINISSIRFDSIRFDSIRFDSIRFDSIRFNLIIFDSEHIQHV